MGCFKLTYQDEDTSLGNNWKVYASGVEKTAGGRKNRKDYYAFGMEMPGRGKPGPAVGYRYGFNGQEKDDEIGIGEGNSYTAMFWQYDSRLGRRWNVDPVVKPWESSYVCFSSNPISYIDPDGDNAGKYVDNDGIIIGDDGVDDDKEYLVQESAEQNLIRNNTADGKNNHS